MTVTLFNEDVDFRNNSLQNVDKINNISGGDVRVENGVSCSFVNAKASIRCNNVVITDADGNIFGTKINSTSVSSEFLKCSEIDTNELRCIDTVFSRVIECDRINTSGTTRIDHAGNLVCLTGKLGKFVDANEIRSGGVCRVDAQGNVIGNVINGSEIQTSGVTRIDLDGVVEGSQVILLGRGNSSNVPMSLSAASNGFIAVTPLGTSPAVSFVLTGNQTESQGLVYEASDSVGSPDAYKAFTAAEKWVCNVSDAYGFFGDYNGKSNTFVEGKQTGGEWVQLTIPSSKGIISYYLNCDSASIEQRPKSWILAGSIDGESFFTIHAHTVDKLTDVQRAFNIPLSSVSIRHFRLIVTHIFPFNGSHLHGSLTIAEIGFQVGFGKDHVRVPKQMFDVPGNICAEAIAFDTGPPIKIDVGYYEGQSLSTIKFKAHFRSTPAIFVSVVNADDSNQQVQITSQCNTGFSARQWGTDLKTNVPVSLSINWTAIGY